MLKPLARDSLINRAVETIHNYIIDREMKGGDPLPSERQMASALFISRVTLRNALAVLEGRGTIHRDRSGAAVVAPTIGMRHAGDPEKLRSELARLRNLRSVAEVGAAEFACRHRTDEDVARLRDIVGDMSRENKAEHSITSKDAAFHFALLRCAGELFVPTFGEMIREFFRLATAARPLVMTNPQNEDIILEHTHMVDALERRDPCALRALLIQSYDKDKAGLSATVQKRVTDKPMETDERMFARA